MDKRSMDILEQAFAAEVDGAINGGIGLFQTRSKKLADQLVADGYLENDDRLIGKPPLQVSLRGYRLTSLGHLTYCTSDRCSDDASIDKAKEQT